MINTSGRADVGAVTACEARRALEDGAVLVDVREADEWIAGHAASAIHLPLAELGEHLADLPTDREIIVVCRSGRRSATAAALLNRHGLHATNLSGGMTAWEAAGLPIVTAGGTAGDGPGPVRARTGPCG